MTVILSGRIRKGVGRCIYYLAVPCIAGFEFVAIYISISATANVSGLFEGEPMYLFTTVKTGQPDVLFHNSKQATRCIYSQTGNAMHLFTTVNRKPYVLIHNSNQETRCSCSQQYTGNLMYMFIKSIGNPMYLFTTVKRKPNAVLVHNTTDRKPDVLVHNSKQETLCTCSQQETRMYLTTVNRQPNVLIHNRKQEIRCTCPQK